MKITVKKLMTLCWPLMLLFGSIPLQSMSSTTLPVSRLAPQTITEPTSIATLFPDKALAQYMVAMLGKPNKDAVVTQGELNGVSALNYNGLSNDPIANLEGLQHLTNVRTIDLQGHTFSDISSLAPLIHVTYLDLSWNNITDITALQHLTGLMSLNLADNKITDIQAVQHLTNLTALRVLQNKIVDVSPVVRLSKLRTLDLSWNSITDLSPLKNNTFSRGIKLDLEQPFAEHPVPLPWQSPFIFQNPVKDVDGTLIAPNRGDFGYITPNLIWTVDPPLDETLVSFRWSKNVTIAGTEVEFSGQYRITLYRTAPVIFIADGLEYASMRVRPNTTIEPPVEPTKDGYTFAGWYTEEDGGNLWNFASDIVPLAGITLYAHWEAIPTYTITFIANDEVHATDEAVAGVLIEVPQTPTKLGYTFVGWYTALEDGSRWDFEADTMPAEHLTLYARFGVDTYEVTYDNEGVATSIPVPYGELLDEPTTPIKEGHTFAGWYTERNDGTRWDFKTDTMPADNITLYARYTINTYHVTFVNEDTQSTSDVTFGALLDAPALEPRVGHTFAGWYTAPTDGTRWDFTSNTMPAEDIILYARYTVNTYRLTYDAEGDKLTIDAFYDELLTEPVAPTKPGYRFIGWYKSEIDGSLWDFATDRMPATNVTLHARFLRNYIMRGNDITIERSTFFSLLENDELHDAIVNLADVKVFHEDDEDTIIYHIGNTTFVVSNMHELLEVKDHGTYNVQLTMYVDPTLADQRALTIELSLNVVPDTVSGGGDEDGNGGNGGNNGGSTLPNTGEAVFEKIIMSLSLIFGAILLLFTKHKKQSNTNK